MANRKWPRPDDDVQRLARLWRDGWTPADGIEPWLRRHLDEMTRLVRDERWRWQDIARALDLAGISYAAAGRGRPWTAELLMDKAAKLRGQRRKQQAWQAASGPGGLTVSVEMLREALSAIGVVNHLTVNLPAPAPPVPPPAPAPRRAVRPGPAARKAAAPAGPAAVSPSAPAAFDPEEAADIPPAFKPASLKGKSHGPTAPPAGPVIPPPPDPLVFDPEEYGRNEVSPEADEPSEFKPATLKGRSRKPAPSGETS